MITIYIYKYIHAAKPNKNMAEDSNIDPANIIIFELGFEVGLL